MEDLKAQLGRSDEWTNQCEENDVVEDNRMAVPTIPSSVSGTALEAVLLRDGWTWPTMYAKYEEATLAVEREEGKKQWEAILKEDVKMDAGCELSSLSSNEVLAELRMSKEETEKWKVEGRASQNQMQHYKSIAEATEAALKQMECSHDSFKIEVEKLKESLKARISELEYEVASATAGKEEARTSALTEIKNLKEERRVKNSQILAMEIKIKGLKEDLERENQRWRAAHANYGRQLSHLYLQPLEYVHLYVRGVFPEMLFQEELNAKWETEMAMLVESMDEAEKKYGEINEQVVLQSETIEEVTKTLQAWASLQAEAFELHRVVNAVKGDNEAKREVERAMLMESKSEAEKKYREISKWLESAVKAAENAQGSNLV